jgi:lathosterol oxidase
MLLLSSFLRADNVVSIFLALSLGFLCLYFGLAGTSHLFFFLRSKRVSVPAKKRAARKDGKAIGLSVVMILVQAVLTAPLIVLIAHGWSRVYFAVEDFGWGYLCFSIAALLLFTETLEYWTHRALHMPWLYKLLHRQHHTFVAHSSWASFAFHPLDGFLQALPYHLFAFLFPVHVVVYAGGIMVVTLWTFLIHEPDPLFGDGFLNGTSHHEVHHTCNKYNYGQFLTIWDRMLKTYRDPKMDVDAAVAPSHS